MITCDGCPVRPLESQNEKSAELEARNLVYKTYELGMLCGGRYLLQELFDPACRVLLAVDGTPVIDIGDDVYLQWEPSMEDGIPMVDLGNDVLITFEPSLE